MDTTKKLTSSKKYPILFLVGAALGVILAAFLAPTFLAWWTAPPTAAGVSCDLAVKWAAERMMWAQAAAAGIGGLLLVILGLVFRRNKKSAAA